MGSKGDIYPRFLEKQYKLQSVSIIVGAKLLESCLTVTCQAPPSMALPRQEC